MLFSRIGLVADLLKNSVFAILLLFCFIACSSSPEQRRENSEQAKQEAAAMHVHFQSGFYQDTVVLYHGSEKVYEKVLTTEVGQKLTDVFSIPKAELSDTLYFKVVQKGGALRGFIPPNADQYVGFYLTSGTAVNIYSKATPFSYE